MKKTIKRSMNITLIFFVRLCTLYQLIVNNFLHLLKRHPYNRFFLFRFIKQTDKINL